MTRKRLIAIAVLAAASAVMLLSWLGRLTATREQEMRVALVARQMVRSGNWLVPEFHGQPRMQKPPLMYWLVAAAFEAARTTSSIAVARLPSALSGVALVLVLYVGGTRLVGRRRAWLGAAAAATSFGLIRHARLAETDILLVLLVSLTAICAYAAVRPRARAWAWPLAGLFAGLGFLTKGPAAIVLPALAVLSFVAVTPASRRRMLSPGVLAAALVCAVISGSWYAAIILQPGPETTTEAAVGGELQQILGGLGHPGPFYYYLYTLPKVMLPWSLLIPFGIWVAWKHARRRAGARFLLGWFLSSFVALSLLRQKQDHYALLLLPPTALLIGLVLARAFSSLRTRWRALSRGYLAAIQSAYALTGLALIVAPLVVTGMPASASVAAGAALLAVGVASLLALRPAGPAVQVLAVLALTSLGAAVYAWLPGDFDRSRTIVPQFVADAAPRLAGAQTVHVAGNSSSLLEFYFGEKARHAESFAEAWERAEPGDLVAFSADRRHPDRLGELPAQVALVRSKKDVVCLLFVKPGPGIVEP